MTTLCTPNATARDPIAMTLEEEFQQDEVLQSCVEEIESAMANEDPQAIYQFVDNASNYILRKADKVKDLPSTQESDIYDDPVVQNSLIVKDAYSQAAIAVESYATELSDRNVLAQTDEENRFTATYYTYSPKSLLENLLVGRAKQLAVGPTADNVDMSTRHAVPFDEGEQEYNPADAFHGLSYDWENMEDDLNNVQDQVNIDFDPSLFYNIPDPAPIPNYSIPDVELGMGGQWTMNEYNTVGIFPALRTQWSVPLQPQKDPYGNAFVLRPHLGFGVYASAHTYLYNLEGESAGKVVPTLIGGVGMLFPKGRFNLEWEVGVTGRLGGYSEKHTQRNELNGAIEPHETERTAKGHAAIGPYLSLGNEKTRGYCGVNGSTDGFGVDCGVSFTLPEIFGKKQARSEP
ncbi:hypothetical protein KJ708_12070 [bacterium]|nr:hypothetical protein [bacterium]MBU1917807.1 hypothetical protein [bacterium]